MSEQQQNEHNQANEQKFNKSKEQRAKQKDNTNAWLKKQEQKKKKKQQEQQQKQQKTGQLDQKALQKAKRKEQKRLQRQQMLKEQQAAKQSQPQVQTKQEQSTIVQAKKESAKQVKPKKDQKKAQEKQSDSNKQTQHHQPRKQPKKSPQSQPSTKQQHPTTTTSPTLQHQSRKLSKENIPIPAHQPTKPTTPHTQLLTLQQHLTKSFPSVSPINKPAQSQLIHKYLDQYVNVNDTVLVLSGRDLWHPSSDKCTKRVYLYPNHEEFSKNPNCENIVCTYEDVAYLMDGTITKIFVELETVFANGTGLTLKGNENIVCLANQFKIPVIGFSGTWNFNAWNFLSRDMFMNKYGERQVEKYDIVENQQLEIIVLEIGSVIPKQISGHLENLSKIYRGCDFNSIKW